MEEKKEKGKEEVRRPKRKNGNAVQRKVKEKELVKKQKG